MAALRCSKCWPQLVREVDELAITENLAGERFAQGFYDIIILYDWAHKLGRLKPDAKVAQNTRQRSLV